jgi:hypothetical protein
MTRKERQRDNLMAGFVLAGLMACGWLYLAVVMP